MQHFKFFTAVASVVVTEETTTVGKLMANIWIGDKSFSKGRKLATLTSTQSNSQLFYYAEFLSSLCSFAPDRDEEEDAAVASPFKVQGFFRDPLLRL